MASQVAALSPRHSSTKYHAQWIGGPPKQDLVSLWDKFESVGISIIDQAEFRIGNRPYAIPDGINLILVNQENTNPIFADLVRAAAKDRGIPCAMITREWSRAKKLLQQQKLLPEDDVGAPSPVVVPSKPAPKVVLKAAEQAEPATPAAMTAAAYLESLTEESLAMLPPLVAESMRQAQRTLVMHKRVEPLAREFALLDDEAALTLVSGFSAELRSRFETVLKATANS